MITPFRIYTLLLALVLLWCIGIIAAPLLAVVELQGGAKFLYSFYSHVCHQLNSRSFHIADEKLGVCIRCTSLYFGFLVGLICIAIFKKVQSHRIPQKRFLLLCILLLLFDVGFRVTGIFAGNEWTRIVSGVLFGICAAWYILPLLIEAITQLYKSYTNHPKNSGNNYARETA
jgi:uncharacterized membrane protein